MNILTREELKMLAGSFAPPCVSIVLPMHQAGADIQADPIRLRNLLRQAEERLKARGMREREIGDLLEPVYGLFQNNRLFWRSPSRGLAIFRSQDCFRYYRLPIQFDELAVVNDRFYLKPLLPLFSGNSRFYVLAFCDDGPQLLEGTDLDLHTIDAEQMPTGLAAALQDESIKAQAPGERRISLAHEPEVRENLVRGFRTVDRALHDLLRAEGAPLVLAGPDYLLRLYREANSYPHLIADVPTSNNTELRAEELHRHTWKAVGPYFRMSMDKAIEQYTNAAGTGRASSQLTDVVSAACTGRVATLFVDDSARLWGTFDPVESTVHLAPAEQPNAEELSDFAAVQVLLNGGIVYPLAGNSVPDGAPMAALFRY